MILCWSFSIIYFFRLFNNDKICYYVDSDLYCFVFRKLATERVERNYRRRFQSNMKYLFILLVTFKVNQTHALISFLLLFLLTLTLRLSSSFRRSNLTSIFFFLFCCKFVVYIRLSRGSSHSYGRPWGFKHHIALNGYSSQFSKQRRTQLMLMKIH